MNTGTPNGHGPSSILDLYRIGLGPSSSHTMGPMRAANRFLEALSGLGILDAAARVRADLFGSLACTGPGHGTDGALILGLEGVTPEAALPGVADERLRDLDRGQALRLAGKRDVPFRAGQDIVHHPDQVLPGHPNGLRLTALDSEGRTVLERVYYSVGGGTVTCPDDPEPPGDAPDLPYPYRDAASMVAMAEDSGLSVAEMTMANEAVLMPREQVAARLLAVRDAMLDCAARGLEAKGELPGNLGVRRRARALYERFARRAEAGPLVAPMAILDWLNAHALAVAEENAAGGRVVTAPTNGAAGILPAVLAFYRRFAEGADQAGELRLLLAAGAVGNLYRDRASISGAEVGCQGEVGVACSMAAAGLVAALQGGPPRVEHAAEMAMEHNLGLTCDPVAGLVQIPCIERNAMGAVKAVNAARLAMCEQGRHRVGLDQVMATMLQTGRDMRATYKETSLAGLAVNVTVC